MRKTKTSSAIGSLIFAILFAVGGAFAYANNYHIVIFNVIPLNGLAFFIIAVLLLAFAVYGLVKARGTDKTSVDFVQTQLAQAQAMQTRATPLSAPCAVTLSLPKVAGQATKQVTVYLNGQQVGVLKTNDTIQVVTHVCENSLLVVNTGGGSQPTQFPFAAIASMMINVAIIGNADGSIRVEGI